MLPTRGRAYLSSRRVVIMGCGMIGALIAIRLSDRGNIIRVIDPDPSAFHLLPTERIDSSRIVPIVGDGTLEADLRRASTQDAEIFIAMTGKDTWNALGAQIAKHLLQVPLVICRMNDLTRKEMYNELGIVAISATDLVADMVVDAAVG